MIIDILTDAIRANIGPLKAAPKNWWKRCCMLCHTQGNGKDTRNRFGIQFNPQSIALNCFNCGFSAGYTNGKELSKSFKFFLRQIHVDEKLIKEVEFEIFKKLKDIKLVREGDDEREPERELRLRSLFQKWKPVDLPADSMPISQWLEHGLDDPSFLKVVEYALSRKLYNLDKFYWSPQKSHNLNQRIIIPYYFREKIVGFTSRLSYDTNNRSIPKYYQQCPADFVYNLDNQQEWSRKYVIVNEGVLDAYAVDGVSTLGEPGQAKVDIINRLQKQVVVCPDRDKKGWDLVEVAIENNWGVAFPKWDIDIKDAAAASRKYGRLLTTYSIISSIITNKDKILLQWKLSHNDRERKRDY